MGQRWIGSIAARPNDDLLLRRRVENLLKPLTRMRPAIATETKSIVRKSKPRWRTRLEKKQSSRLLSRSRIAIGSTVWGGAQQRVSGSRRRAS